MTLVLVTSLDRMRTPVGWCIGRAPPRRILFGRDSRGPIVEYLGDTGSNPVTGTNSTSEASAEESSRPS